MAYTPGSPVRQQLVDLDEAALVDLTPVPSQAELVGVRAATDARR